MPDETINAFVSHINEDDAHIGRLKNLLLEAGMEVRDSSINRTNPNDAHDEEYIKRDILAPRIQWAGVLIVLISPGTRESDWVNWEIKYANGLGKRIVGVWTHGAADCDVPSALDLYADAVVGWNSERILAAISGEVNNWEPCEGGEPGHRPVVRHTC